MEKSLTRIAFGSCLRETEDQSIWNDVRATNPDLFLFIGDNVVAAGATKILSNVPAGRVMMGYPAVKMETNTEMYKAQRRLPRILKDIDALKKAVFK